MRCFWCEEDLEEPEDWAHTAHAPLWFKLARLVTKLSDDTLRFSSREDFDVRPGSTL